MAIVISKRPLPQLGTKASRPERVPSLVSIRDLKHGPIDPEHVLNIGKLYDLGIQTNNDEHFARMGHWHPSSVLSCKRAQVWQYLRIAPTDEVSKKMKVIFEIGHLVHDLVQSRMEKLGAPLSMRGLRYEFQREKPFDPDTDILFRDLDIGGTADGILRLWNDDFEQRGVLEVKSMAPKAWDELLPKKNALMKHLMQAHLYAWRFDLPIIWVFYVNKSTGERQVKTHLFDDSIFNKAIAYFSECADYAARKETPPREEDYMMCKECLYRTKCKPPKLRGAAQHNTPRGSIRRRP